MQSGASPIWHTCRQGRCVRRCRCQGPSGKPHGGPMHPPPRRRPRCMPGAPTERCTCRARLPG
ncbi:unnamed protein product [Spirodela intermedia]|uniref:Uncharacterized protein n=2 Tax=Spirodela intermedia TaxID=51605 RepID=A0A7I8IUP3_SPIIN|nr:unnamed protein product [Spirodela intermedia]CAA6661695.1 unnamed protein product [Spirodela intermedia]CAA7398068.1 unnamed protein product [Spirodela intermedia]